MLAATMSNVTPSTRAEVMRLKPTVNLSRRLTAGSAVLFGLSYICPTVIISTFGVLAQETRGAAASAYLIATAAILLTAFSYGRMAARYPQAGSAYTYVSKSVNADVGFVTGWVLILDYFFVPMVICLFTAKAIEVVLPGVSYRFWIAAIAGATTVINILGIQVANRVNFAIMAAQLTVIAALIICSVAYVESHNHTLHAWSAAPFLNPRTGLSAVMSGAAIAAYSFLGFDAVTTLSEETVEPTRNIPRATVLAAAVSGLIYVVTAYLLALVHPSLQFKDIDNAGYEVLAMVSGKAFIILFTVVLVAYAASVMCAQAGSSRLLYAMGRDGMLPARLFSYLHPRFRTPVFGILLTGMVMLVGDWIDLETAASCVNFGAFSAFLAVNLCVVIDHTSGRKELPGGAVKVIQAAAGALSTIWLLLSLHKIALTLGFLWLILGLAYLLIRTRRRRMPLQAMTGHDDVRIRLGVPADAPILAAFAARTFEETFGADNRPEDLRAHLASSFGVDQQTRELLDPNEATLLVHQGETLLGFAQVRPNRPPAGISLDRPVELHRFYIDRAAHGKGIAQRLMGAVHETARRFSAQHLWLSVWERNPRAIAFYMKSGFADAGSTDFFVGSDRQTDRIFVSTVRRGLA
jgi:putrescine importer